MYKTILVPVDGSVTAESGLREAIGLAAATNARLVLLHVIDDFRTLMQMASVSSYNAIIDRMRQHGRSILDRARQQAAEQGVEADTLLREVTQARVSQVIDEEARSNSCDLIVMGTHGRRGLSRLTMGSNAEALARMSPTPVMLVREDQALAA